MTCYISGLIDKNPHFKKSENLYFMVAKQLFFYLITAFVFVFKKYIHKQREYKNKLFCLGIYSIPSFCDTVTMFFSPIF